MRTNQLAPSAAFATYFTWHFQIPLSTESYQKDTRGSKTESELLRKR